MIEISKATNDFEIREDMDHRYATTDVITRGETRGYEPAMVNPDRRNSGGGEP